MRGKVISSPSTNSYLRITPAYAGKSIFPETVLIVISGSPPPMRGKAPAYDPKQANNRITPAYAGKSFSNVTGFFKEQDHPRLCGEKGWQTKAANTVLGSPPPMRGKVVDIVYQLQQEGITPAYAGKSPP